MCLNPLKGFRLPDGSVKVVSRETKVVYKSSTGSWLASPALDAVGRETIRDSIQIPCGHCIDCRLTQSRQWATRMMLEAEYHMYNYFVTLTYDPRHIPKSSFLDYDTGQVLPSYTLRKTDLQKFFKRLRRRCEYHDRPLIRYYAAGEYGDETHRPHYHAIIFGLYLDDLVPLKKSRLGYQYFRSAFLESLWPFGMVTVGVVSWQDCAYVARYCTKKLGGDYKAFYDTFGLEPEFAIMSRNPGIGYQYFEDHADEIYKMDEIFLRLTDGGKKVKPPHYYDTLYKQIDEAQLEVCKERRQRYAESAERLQRRASGLTDDERLQARADLLMRKAQALVRPDC